MDETKSETLAHTFGSGAFEFGQWRTPFENTRVEVLEVAFAPPRPWPDAAAPDYRDRSLLRAPGDSDLTARVYSYDTNSIYRVVFEHISAFRLLDEGGLLQFWEKTEALGGRPAKTTFKVRNHLWAEESFVSFFLGTNDGWSFIIASDNECLEVLSAKEPVVSHEDNKTSKPEGNDSSESCGP